MAIKISRTRERIKNMLLFHAGSPFDSGNPGHVTVAEKIAANGSIAFKEYLDAEGGAGLDTLKAELIEDAEWWNPDPNELEPA